MNHAPIPTDGAAHTRPRGYDVVCKSCGAGWNGLKTCHCTVCHRTFSTIAAFDKHRRGSYELDTRHCVDPVEAGLILTARDYPCWGRGYGE